MKLLRLSRAELERLFPDRMIERSRKIARRVLVDGCPQVDVAVEFGVSKQNVNQLVLQLSNLYSTSPGIQGGLVRVEFDIDRELAMEIEAFVNAAKSHGDPVKVQEAVAKARSSIRSATRSLQ